MTDSAAILELVQAMNRARARGTTDEDQALVDKQKAYCERYLEFIGRELELDPDYGIDLILRFHIVAIAAGLWSSGLPYPDALLIGATLASYLVEQISEAYKSSPSSSSSSS